MTKSLIFLYCLLGFIGGVAVASFISFPVLVVWLGAILGFCAMAVGARKKNVRVAVFAIGALCFVGGALRYSAAVDGQPRVEEFDGGRVRFEGIIVGEPVVTEKSQQMTVEGRLIFSGATAGEEPEKLRARIVARLYPRYKFGDAIIADGAFTSPFDDEFQNRAMILAKDGISGTMVFPHIEKTGEGRGGVLAHFLFRAKSAFTNAIDRILPDPHAALLKGLLFGERASLPAETVESFRAAGVSHIVALSGYNITLVGRSFLAALLWLTVPFRASFWIASAAIVLFIAMVGASPSVVRAGILGLLLLVAEREGRIYNIRNALVFAGATMVFVNPLILRFDAAFQLSFLATMGLVYFSDPVEKYTDRILRRIRRLAGDYRVLRRTDKSFTVEKATQIKRLFIETIAAQIAVLPLLISFFGAVSLVSPVANILTLTAVPSAMALGFLTGLWGILHLPFAGVVAAVAWLALEYILRVSDFFSRIPLASVAVGKWVAVILVLSAGILLLFKKMRPSKISPC